MILVDHRPIAFSKRLWVEQDIYEKWDIVEVNYTILITIGFALKRSHQQDSNEIRDIVKVNDAVHADIRQDTGFNNCDCEVIQVNSIAVGWGTVTTGQYNTGLKEGEPE